MNFRPRLLTASLTLVLLIGAQGTARADDADKAACVNKSEGDACERGDGDAGVCVPDESDANVLTCEDTVGGGNDDNSGDDSPSCSVTPSAAAPGLAGLLALGLLFGVRGRTRRRR